MFGKGVFQEEEILLRDIIRSIDKKLDYSAKEGEGSKFSVHVKLRNHEADVVLDLEDLKAAPIGHGEAASNPPEDQSLVMTTWTNRVTVPTYLGLKSERLLRAAPKI
jgi:hypothetical protein